MIINVLLTISKYKGFFKNPTKSLVYFAEVFGGTGIKMCKNLEAKRFKTGQFGVALK